MDLKSSVKQQTSTTLSKDLLQSYGAGRVFKYNSDINSMDFRADGEVMVVSSVDDSLQVYDVNQGKLTKTTFAKRYGVGVVRFTHHPNAVICASNNDWGDDAIRYLSLYDNRYLRYFKGHKAKVVALEMSPCDDTFISGSLDSTIRLWDIRSNVCQGFISLPERARGRPAVAFDPMGLCFAIATGDNFVKLFDVKSYDKGPFANFKVEGPPITIMSLSFSPDGQHLLLSTDTDQVLLLDAYEGKLTRTFTRSNERKIRLETCFSPDAKFVLSGSEDGSINVWDIANGSQVATWSGDSQASSLLKWCPRRHLVASASNKLALWIPDMNRLRDQQNKDSLRAAS